MVDVVRLATRGNPGLPCSLTQVSVLWQGLSHPEVHVLVLAHHFETESIRIVTTKTRVRTKKREKEARERSKRKEQEKEAR